MPSKLRSLLPILLLGLPASVSAQVGAVDHPAARETVSVAPGPRYQAGWLHRLFLGSHYRDLWTTPVNVEVLDLATYAGGLRPTRRGGGQQTKSLRLKGADGRQYAFRSVDKDPAALLPVELRGTVVSGLLQDQISAGHPVAPLLVAPLLQAAGVLHSEPHLVQLPDGDPRLGEFEPDFGGMLGLLEQRPDAAEDGEASFTGAREIISSDKLMERVEQDPKNQVDARAFLAARLVDVFLGDWDRHRDQWRWARLDDEPPTRWVPIPRDRDQAFAKYDGFLLTVARGTAPQLVKFGPRYPGMLGLTWNGRDLDRRFLVVLERPVWDSIALSLQSRFTDEVIERAVARLPASYQPLDSARLAGALKQRRDDLPAAAGRFYRHLAEEVDVHTTDADEVIVAQREGDVSELTVAPRGADGSPAEPFFRRRFDRRDTKEVRLYPHGGDDRVIVRGSGGAVRLRVIGGGGQDEVADSSRGGKVEFYPHGENDRVAAGSGLTVSRKPYHPGTPAQRDWGRRWLSQLWATAGPDIGLFFGAGVVYTRYGFRQDPFARRYRLRAGYATGASTGRGEFLTEWHPRSSGVKATLLARASGIDVLAFHGFGNETVAPGGREFFRVNQVDLTLAPALSFPLARRVEVTVGTRVRYSSTDFDENRFINLLRPYGSGEFGMLSATGDVRIDTRDRQLAATRGVLVTAGGSFFPGVFDVEEAFGEVHGEAATYLTARALPLEPTLAIRAGGKRVWGRFPYQESAFIGDNATVRLGRQNRFAGESSLYGGAELRLFLTQFNVVLPGDFGIFGLGDVGRVYLDGESSDKWHAAGGGGIWVSFLSRANTVSLAVARSEDRTGVYARAGFGF